jgi:hypothetical protein
MNATMKTVAVYFGIAAGLFAGTLIGHNGFPDPWRAIAVVGTVIFLFSALIFGVPPRR